MLGCVFTSLVKYYVQGSIFNTHKNTFVIATRSTHDEFIEETSVTAMVEELGVFMESTMTIASPKDILNSGKRVTAVVQIKVKGSEELRNGVLVGEWTSFSAADLSKITLYMDMDLQQVMMEQIIQLHQ